VRACASGRVSWRNEEHGHICLSVQLPPWPVFPDSQRGATVRGSGVCWLAGSRVGGARQRAPGRVAAGWVGAVVGAAAVPVRAGAGLPVPLQPEPLVCEPARRGARCCQRPGSWERACVPAPVFAPGRSLLWCGVPRGGSLFPRKVKIKGN